MKKMGLTSDKPASLSHQDGTRSYPLTEGFGRLGIGYVKGYALVKSGEIETFTIGARRYITDNALQQFIRKRIELSLQESHEDRAKRAMMQPADHMSTAGP